MDWHDLLTLILTDFFVGSPYDVESEVDLSLQKQFLDVVVIRKREGTFTRPLPDGMTELVEYNLISFKSYQDTFDEWTLEELLSHYVAYRKSKSPSPKNLLPKEQFQLFGLSARFPSEMAKVVRLQPVQPGVYDRIGDLKPVRLIVLNELPMEQQNAMLQLLSAKEHQLRYACREYRQYSSVTSTLIQKLLNLYREEGIPMAITMEDLRKEVKKEFWGTLTQEEKKEYVGEFAIEDRLEGVPVEDLLKRVPVEDRFKGVPVEDRFKGVSLEVIENYLNQQKKSARSGDSGS